MIHGISLLCYIRASHGGVCVFVDCNVDDETDELLQHRDRAAAAAAGAAAVGSNLTAAIQHGSPVNRSPNKVLT